MKALTVKQPHAWALVFGPKRVENRVWATSVRGPVAIHAGRARDQLGLLEDEAWRAAVAGDGGRESGVGIPRAEQLAMGRIIGVIEVVDCVSRATWQAEHGDDPFACGPWCWVRGRRWYLRRPPAVRGQQRLWEVDDGVIERAGVVGCKRGKRAD